MTNDLFKPITRTERQHEAIKLWLKNRCKGTFSFCTGFGKTFTAITIIKLLLTRFPDLRILVVVPTEGLQKQWMLKLDEQGLSLNTEVLIINSAIKEHHNCDLLIIDEIHRAAADGFSKIFTQVDYKYILGLTATLERLDGKHVIIERYCPVVDSITLVEATVNGWVADSVEYKIVLNVKDIYQYQALTSEFNSHFEYFGWNFEMAMNCVGKNGYKFRMALRDKICQQSPNMDKSDVLKAITLHATSLMRVMQARKKFINEHPDKLRLTQEIIKHRPNAKIITFSATIDIAEKIGVGYVYSSKQTRKKGRLTIEEFAQLDCGVLNTSKKADEGLDLPGVNTLIILGQDSSPTRFCQRQGRAVRKEGNKVAEIFTFVIAGTTEEEWYKSSHRNESERPPIVLDEQNLLLMLQGQPYETYKKPVQAFTFRF